MNTMRFTLEVADPYALDLFEAGQESLRRFGQTRLVEKYDAKHGHSAPDGFLTITKTPEVSTRYFCEAKRQLNPSAVNAVVSRLKDMASDLSLKPLLLTEYVSPSLAEMLKSLDVAYLDRAGNALLVDPPLIIWLRGFKLEERGPRTSRAFQTTGLRLIAFLLKMPEAINWPYRRLADQAKLSLGSTSRILGDLRNLGFIGLVGPNQNALVNREGLLEQWEFGYLSRLRASLKPQRYRQADAATVEQLPERLPKAMKGEILVGGELAAAIAVRHIRPQSVVLHVRPHRPLLPILKELKLLPDPSGNVTLIEQPDASGTWQWRGIEAADLVHPLLVHAELLNGRPDDRLRETARMIYDHYLTPAPHHEPATPSK